MESHYHTLPDKLNSYVKLPAEVMAELVGLFKPCRLSAGSFFVHEGERPYRLGYLIKGILREFYVTSKGKEFNNCFCFPGDFTGSFYDLLKQQPSTVNIQTLTEVVVLVADYKEFYNLVYRFPILERLGRLIAEELFKVKCERVYELLTMSPQERYTFFKKKYAGFEDIIPHYHIATFLGITPISFSRIRNKEKRDQPFLLYS
jgi:CRP-like cAMP-binding protein